MDKINASRITSSRCLEGATFVLARWRLASNRATWRSTCAFGMSFFDDEYDRAAALRHSRRHQHAPVLCLILFINAHFVADNASHALASSATAKPTFNIEEVVIVINNGWTPKKKKKNTQY